MKSICVFCGSRPGAKKLYLESATTTGEWLAENNYTLVYGGGHVGLMGAMANGAISRNGTVIGIIPDFLMQKEVGHLGISELIVTQDMMERKVQMMEKSDAFLALPGGYGTLDEIAEVLTWNQLDVMDKPFYLYNCQGFFDPLLNLFDKMVDQEFLDRESVDRIIIKTSLPKIFLDIRQRLKN